MKKPQAILAGVVFTLGLIFILHVQDTLTPDATSVAAMSDLEVELKAVESVPPMPADSLPTSWTFRYSQHAPDSEEQWPRSRLRLAWARGRLATMAFFFWTTSTMCMDSPKNQNNLHERIHVFICCSSQSIIVFLLNTP
ncbi:MAG TPA: hypothetical protein VIK35_01370 [Verrucomicrobiae bacterium]